jgi:hypothetical protein
MEGPGFEESAADMTACTKKAISCGSTWVFIFGMVGFYQIV